MDGLELLLGGLSAAAIPTSIAALFIAMKANKIAKEQPAIAVDRERRGQLLEALQAADEQIDTARGQVRNNSQVAVDHGVFEAASTLLKRQQRVYRGGTQPIQLRFMQVELDLSALDQKIGDVIRKQGQLDHYRNERNDHGQEMFSQVQHELTTSLAEFRDDYTARKPRIAEEIQRLTDEERESR